ncbi:nuclear transport factor 2 family protein [Arthrobacter sp. OAP107]|uniref:nuclear transport factor 2 family protein n=1 Tax=Arthrobacter sp. OAP107 TaxID=3156445 RepID=UPI003396F8FA
MVAARIDAEAVVVQRLEDQRYSAVLAGDVDTFERLCHPELIYTHSGGNRDSLTAYTDKLRTGAVRYHRIDHRSENITIIGNTALVSVQMNADLTVNGTSMTMHNSALAVWVREEGSWKFVAYQATPQLHV